MPQTLFTSKNIDRKLQNYDNQRILNSNISACNNDEIKQHNKIEFIENQQNELKITTEFYTKYKAIRLQLFQHLQTENPSIDKIVLLEKAQKLLVRIIFICFCSDFEILPTKILQKTPTWTSLKLLFEIIDKEYFNLNKNNHLFTKDKLLDSLQIRNNELQKVFELVEFDYRSELNVNILGHIFEQSISDLEKLKQHKNPQGFENLAGLDVTKGKRKDLGVFYTPDYVTQYIVKESTGDWLADIHKSARFLKSGRFEATPEYWNEYLQKLLSIKILDPSCGCGAFLVATFDFLLNEHLTIQKELKRLNVPPLLFDIEEHIIKNNLFGVDINAESVEITKLILWLKTIKRGKQLPDIQNNIQHGNSLIENTEIADNLAFNWNCKFKDIMEAGGFDVIVGNPPYVDSETMSKNSPKEREYISRNYQSAKGNWDLCVPFIEKSLQLINENGYVSMITPNKWLSMDYGKSIRAITKNYLCALSDFSNFKVFQDASIFPIVFILNKKENRFLKTKVVTSELKYSENIVEKNTLNEKDNFGFFFSNQPEFILSIQQQKQKLGDFCEISDGFSTSEAYLLIPYITEYKEDEQNPHFKFINTGTIERYITEWDIKPTTYIKQKYFRPIVYQSDLKNNFAKRYQRFNQPKIIISGIRHFEAFFDKHNEYIAGKSTLVLKNLHNDFTYETILAILNSELISRYLKECYNTSGMDGGINFSPNMIKNIPIPLINNEIQTTFAKLTNIITIKWNDLQKTSKNFIDLLQSEVGIKKITRNIEHWYNADWLSFSEEIKKQNNHVALNEMLKWKNFFIEQKTVATKLTNEINMIDNEINNLVYSLYQL